MLIKEANKQNKVCTWTTLNQRVDVRKGENVRKMSKHKSLLANTRPIRMYIVPWPCYVHVCLLTLHVCLLVASSIIWKWTLIHNLIERVSKWTKYRMVRPVAITTEKLVGKTLNWHWSDWAYSSSSSLMMEHYFGTFLHQSQYTNWKWIE